MPQSYAEAQIVKKDTVPSPEIQNTLDNILQMFCLLYSLLNSKESNDKLEHDKEILNNILRDYEDFDISIFIEILDFINSQLEIVKEVLLSNQTYITNVKSKNRFWQLNFLHNNVVNENPHYVLLSCNNSDEYVDKCTRLSKGVNKGSLKVAVPQLGIRNLPMGFNAEYLDFKNTILATLVPATKLILHEDTSKAENLLKSEIRRSTKLNQKYPQGFLPLSTLKSSNDQKYVIVREGIPLLSILKQNTVTGYYRYFMPGNKKLISFLGQKALYVTFIQEICKLLLKMHENKEIHGDIKPSNIVIVVKEDLNNVDLCLDCEEEKIKQLLSILQSIDVNTLINYDNLSKYNENEIAEAITDIIKVITNYLENKDQSTVEISSKHRDIIIAVILNNSFDFDKNRFIADQIYLKHVIEVRLIDVSSTYVCTPAFAFVVKSMASVLEKDKNPDYKILSLFNMLFYYYYYERNNIKLFNKFTTYLSESEKLLCEKVKVSLLFDKWSSSSESHPMLAYRDVYALMITIFMMLTGQTKVPMRCMEDNASTESFNSLVQFLLHNDIGEELLEIFFLCDLPVNQIIEGFASIVDKALKEQNAVTNDNDSSYSPSSPKLKT